MDIENPMNQSKLEENTYSFIKNQKPEITLPFFFMLRQKLSRAIYRCHNKVALKVVSYNMD